MRSGGRCCGVMEQPEVEGKHEQASTKAPVPSHRHHRRQLSLSLFITGRFTPVFFSFFFSSSNLSESTQNEPRLFNIVLPINNLALRHLSTWHSRPYWVPLGGIQPASFLLLAHWSVLDLNGVVTKQRWHIPQSMLIQRDYWNGLRKSILFCVLYWI